MKEITIDDGNVVRMKRYITLPDECVMDSFQDLANAALAFEHNLSCFECYNRKPELKPVVYQARRLLEQLEGIQETIERLMEPTQ